MQMYDLDTIFKKNMLVFVCPKVQATCSNPMSPGVVAEGFNNSSAFLAPATISPAYHETITETFTQTRN